MPLTIPPELKKITPFVRRAEELDKDSGNPESRLVAYYCRQYAVHTGIEAATSAAGKGVLGELLGSLEKEKEAMNSFTRDEAKFLCRKFADKIFDKADLEDRTGDANKNTAKTFYAAASFLEILQQFYKDDDGSEEREEEKKRAVYSKWKATEILKAIKEGRQHTPGGYGEDEEEEEPEVTEEAQHAPHDPSMEVEVETVVDNDDEEEEEEPSTLRIPAMEEDEEEPVEAGTEVELPPPSYPGEAPSSTIQPPPPAPVVYRPPVTFDLPPVPPPMSMPAPPTAKPQPPPEPTKPAGFFGLGKKKKLSKAEIADATELTRFALAALEDKNIDVAGDRLKQALHALGR